MTVSINNSHNSFHNLHLIGLLYFKLLLFVMWQVHINGRTHKLTNDSCDYYRPLDNIFTRHSVSGVITRL